MADAKLIGPKVLVRLNCAEAGADTPVENWGRLDDLKGQGKKERKDVGLD